MKIDATTIQLKKSVVKELNSIKSYPRQTYNDVILDLIRMVKSARKTSQYDEFLYRIQQQKMRELWDNNADEAWEHA